MTFAELQRALAAGNIPPVLLFHGEEPYLARIGVRLLRRTVLAPGSDAFDFVSLSGRETTAEAIVSQAGTVPMLSERRLTVVYEFDGLSPTQRTKLLEYVRAPYDGSCLALVSFSRLSGRNKFEQGLLSAATVVECGNLGPDALTSLVSKMARERDIAIDADALSVLLDWTSGDLSRVDNELGKLQSFVEARSTDGDSSEVVTVSDIETVVGAKASSLGDLVAAVAERRSGDALAGLAELVDGGIEPAQLVSQLFGCWTALWLIRAGGGGGGRFSPGGSARVTLSSISDLRSAAMQRTSREYAQGIELFYRADVDIRRGMAAAATVGLLVHGLTSGAWGS